LTVDLVWVSVEGMLAEARVRLAELDAAVRDELSDQAIEVLRPALSGRRRPLSSQQRDEVRDIVTHWLHGYPGDVSGANALARRVLGVLPYSPVQQGGAGPEELATGLSRRRARSRTRIGWRYCRPKHG